MTTRPTSRDRLRFIADSPVQGLAVAQRRVPDARASVLAVHGALDRGGSFARLARRLDDFDLVTYDRRGYQGSRDLQPVDLNHHVDDLCALAAREVHRQPVILLGHSFGGVVTFGAAIRDPSLAQLVVNFESPCPWILPRESSRPPVSSDSRAEVERFFKRVVSVSSWERLSEEQRESRRRDGPALLRDLATIQRGETPYDLAELRVPATYAYGDGLLTDYYRALSAELVKISPLITSAEIIGANHAAHLKNPQQLAALVRQQWEVTCASR